MEENTWTRELLDKMPTYRITYFDLVFDSSVSVFKIGREPAEDKWKNMWGENNGEENLVHNDFVTGLTTASKQVFEKKFLVQDTMLQIEWRITDETRDIAGFECRKAVGKFYDSLYVIAFYTDQIAIPSGPALYNGLPGVILGLAFPRFYTTWFATKVELIEPKLTEVAMPAAKGKKINRKELMDQVKNAFQYGSPEERQKYFWNTVL
jgi:GLPGLI family protein